MRRRRRVVAIGTLTVVVALVTAYAVAAAVVWNRLTVVRGECPVDWAGNDPTRFSVPAASADRDWTAYEVESPEEVRLPSRTAGIEIAGWWLQADDAGAPAVVVVHGHNACRRDPAVLVPAGMLRQNGFSVLLIDLRDHGDSTVEDGRFAGGTEEYLDVLGAWDWLQREREVPADRIGLLGVSLGAATTLIAAGEEPRVAAVWEDSSYADIGTAIRAELARNGYPTFLEAGGVAMARLLSGDDLASLSPLGAVRKLDGRPLFVTHGTADTRLTVGFARDLIAAVRADGGAVESWVVAGAEHTQAMFLEPAEYERRLVRFFGASLRR